MTQEIVYLISHGRKLNTTKMVLAELAIRLTMPPATQSKEIFFPRFIIRILNYKYEYIHDLPGIGKTKYEESTTIGKVIFSS